MFTGLIETVGRLTELRLEGKAARLTVACDIPLDEVPLGASVAVDGACLTVTAKGMGTLSFDVSPETLARTALRGLRRGSRVNLERALRLGGRLDGHLVAGHVDCVGRLVKSVEVSGHRRMSFGIPADQARYLAAKGSVAVNGVSLTVNRVAAAGFEITVIPATLSATTLPDLAVGALVNLETDMVAKYLERLACTLHGGLPVIDAGLLRDKGFA